MLLWVAYSSQSLGWNYFFTVFTVHSWLQACMLICIPSHLHTLPITKFVFFYSIGFILFIQKYCKMISSNEKWFFFFKSIQKLVKFQQTTHNPKFMEITKNSMFISLKSPKSRYHDGWNLIWLAELKCVVNIMGDFWFDPKLFKMVVFFCSFFFLVSLENWSRLVFRNWFLLKAKLILKSLFNMHQILINNSYKKQVCVFNTQNTKGENIVWSGFVSSSFS